MGKKLPLFIIVLLATSLCCITFVLAETITLKSGEKFRARIIEKTEEYITIDFYGTVVTYNMYEIESISEEELLPPLEEEALSQGPTPISEGTGVLYKVEELKDTILATEEYVNAEFGISMLKPKDWILRPGNIKLRNQVDDRFKEIITFQKERTRMKILPPRIIISVKSMEPGYQLVDLVNDWVDNFERRGNIENEITEYPQEEVIGGKKFTKWSVVISTLDKYKDKHYYANVGDLLYKITLSAHIEDFDSVHPIFEKLINSIEFK